MPAAPAEVPSPLCTAGAKAPPQQLQPAGRRRSRALTGGGAAAMQRAHRQSSVVYSIAEIIGEGDDDPGLLLLDAQDTKQARDQPPLGLYGITPPLTTAQAAAAFAAAPYGPGGEAAAAAPAPAPSRGDCGSSDSG
ncbi:hypothetical protein MNEG_12299, partial [Monoraphidium neglectum]